MSTDILNILNSCKSAVNRHCLESSSHVIPAPDDDIRGQAPAGIHFEKNGFPLKHCGNDGLPGAFMTLCEPLPMGISAEAADPLENFPIADTIALWGRISFMRS